MNIKKLLIPLFVFAITITYAQQKINPIYRAERTKINDLVHTKLKVSFDYPKRYLYGEEWVTLHPHFYSTNKVTLDAKAMLISKVMLNGKALPYTYKKNKLAITLPKTYKKGENYTLYIKYTARPEDVKQHGSAAITDAKGLYFIDPDGTDPNKPTEIWTQGETEANSVWFPTLDTPNQKTTQEIYMTVPSKYVTLSNGLLVSKTDNKDGTRTDYWKMDLPNAPYLFFMGVGKYSIIKDHWRGIPVNYYVEKKYAPYARQIFGLTPKMIEFYSTITGVPYQWPKYSQIVGRDYVSGAMENTTATLHSAMAYQTPGQLIDKNRWEDVISHELFHHWFGDLVTTESWSNITLNESFANYGEYLWREHEYGKDHADALRYEDLQQYFNSHSYNKDLVRYHYNSPEDLFDRVTYNKGGYILGMLRSYLGDKAFFGGLKKYLNEYKFGDAEVAQLRIAMEDVSGRDLHWFFNQWYYGDGNPILDINYSYDTTNKTVTIHIKQNKQTFKFPIAIDVYENGKKIRHNEWINKKETDFTYKYTTKPALVNVGAKHVLVAQINDNKTLANYIFQYKNAPRYDDRRIAIDSLANHQENKLAYETLTNALNDRYFGLRMLAVSKINLMSPLSKKATKIVLKLAKNDPRTLVRAKAIDALSKLKNKKYISVFKKSLESKSYGVLASSISALYPLDKESALNKIKTLNKDEKKDLSNVLIEIYIKEKDKSELPYISKHLLAAMFFTKDKTKRMMYKKAFDWVAKSDNEKATQNIVDQLVKNGIQYKSYGFNRVAQRLLQQIMMAKQVSTYSNKKVLINIVQKGLDKLNKA